MITVSILQGFMKKVSTFINYDNNNSYYYEYLYFSFSDFDYLNTKTININEIDNNISIFDNFSSLNRRQFNILNIPFQNENIKRNIKSENSFLVCEVFYQDPKNPYQYGFFNIKEILFIYPFIQINNNIYDKYYDDFGNILDFLAKKYHREKEDKQEKFVNDCIVKLSKYFNKLQISLKNKELTVKYKENENRNNIIFIIFEL